jgi:hypothetical protein
MTFAVPACFVTTAKPAPPPSGRNNTTTADVRDHRTNPDEPRAHVNPPRPTGDTPTQEHPGHTTPPPKAEPGNDTMQQSPPTKQASLRSWNVFMSGKDCYTSYNVTCPPKGATCNPPPPQKLERCPSGITAERPMTIREDPADSCALYYPMPDCPPGVACNPPRPQKIECPTR